MKQTSTQGFSFPEDEDYATPVQLKLLAEQFDTNLFGVQTGLNAKLRPVSILRTLAADITGVGFGAPQDWSAGLTVTYNNGWSTPTAFAGPPEPGTYIMGACVQAVCASTITANTFRRLQLIVPVPTGPVYAQVMNNVFQETANENGNATLGNQLTAFGMLTFDFTSSNPPQPWGCTFWHLNTGSTMTIKAGSFIWATKIADLEN